MPEPLALRGLESESRYRVTDFTDEVLGRRQHIIRAMQPQLKALVAGLLTALGELRAQDPGIELDAVKMEQVEWTATGQLLVTLRLPRRVLLAHEREPRPLERYWIDDFVAELMLIEGYAHTHLTAEVAQFTAALVDQFGVLHKHHALRLPQIAFANMRLRDRATLCFDITYEGKPFTPRTAGWT